MKIVEATVKEFDSVRLPRGILHEETKAVLEMAVDSVIRIVGHEHKIYDGKTGACAMRMTIYQTLRRRNMTVSFRHDGPDLLVMRIK